MGFLDTINKISDEWMGGQGIGPTGNMLRRTQKDPIPTLQNVELDAGTKDLLARQMAESQKSEGDIAKGWLSGAQKGGADILSGGGEAPNALGGTMPAGYQEALGRRANKKYEQDFNKMERQANIDAKAEKFRRSSQLANVYAKKQNTILEDANRQNAATLQQAQARNAVIGQALGTFGSMFGTLFGGMMGGGGGKQQSAAPASGGQQQSSAYGGGTQANQSAGYYDNSGGAKNSGGYA